MSATLAEGDKARVKPDAKGPNGMARKTPGREGLIENRSRTHTVIRFSNKRGDFALLPNADVEAL